MVADHSAEHPPDEVPYFEWFKSTEVMPPDLNEEILMYIPVKNVFELARSFVRLQNEFYRTIMDYPTEEFYWMRIRGVDGQEHYPQ